MLMGMSLVSGEQLFEVAPGGAEAAVAEPRGRADKRFRVYAPGQGLLMPPSLDDWLPEDHLARFVGELVDHVLNLDVIFDSYTEASGAPPYDPRLMLKLLVYGYATGVTSSRAIERRCVTDVALRFLAANAAPDYRSISRFRRRHLAAVEALFTQSVVLCTEAGMVGLGRVAVDGTKVRASASRHKAMSYDRLVPKEAEIAAQVRALLDEAERVDRDEDERFGADHRGDEVPEELRTKAGRLAKLRAAKAALEAEAAERAAAEAAERAVKRGDDEATVAAKASEAARRAVPRPKAQRNFTDPESRIMKTSDGSFHQCFNGQAAVDATAQVIVGITMTNTAPDVGHLVPLVDQVTQRCGRAPRQVVADAGYWSEPNAAALAERQIDAFIATGRLKHGEQLPPAPRGRIPAATSPKERMARKLRTKKGRAVYARRKVDVEPVFGQMRTRQDAGRSRLRGLEGAHGEWTLHSFCHNIQKLFTRNGIAGLRPAAAG
jgi:transposase